MKAKTQKILAAGAALALLGIMAASLLLRRDRVVERTDFLMSTVVDQKITGREAEKTGDRVVEMLQELEHTLSLYDEASEIAAVNAAAGRNAVTVSEGTYKLLKRSTASTTIQSTTANIASAFKSAANTSSFANPKEYLPLAGRPARTLASSAKKREAESVTMCPASDNKASEFDKKPPITSITA